MINCPSCNGVKFESHHVAPLFLLDDGTIVRGAESQHYTCVQCDYVIANPSDLNMLTVTVYVLGNSMSKQRQGLSTFGDGLCPMPSIREKLISNPGYFIFTDTKGDPCKNGPWVFTKAAWEKYQADPQFPLAEGQHITEVKELY
ncbi:MAG TPA: hypothetical protein ENI27_04975 [bacterium]|nr:hypothetical protein [bacterium]